MMPPNPAPMGPPPMGQPPAPNAMKPGVTDGPSPDEVKQQLVGMLKQVKRVAEQNGVNWSEVLSEVQDNESKASATLPRPPMGMPK